ncbi:hypothetical protein F4818DRAFT_413888 [Hypoxylon cercidicola]|nr:hypothetical protein F4818DRAFT_413888 [Hypoxylon cercidicola]
MAKERADKPPKEKAEKAEKKVSMDKVKKHKKDKKPKSEESLVTSSVDVDLGELDTTPVESLPESLAAASTIQYKDKKEKRRKERKQKRVEKENLKGKSRKAAIEAAIAEGASNDNTPNTVEQPVQSTSKSSDDESDADEGAPLFAIDVNPGHVVPKVLEEKPEPTDTAEDEQRGPKKTKPPSGLNRQERRRIRQIEEQREKIQNKLGMVPGGPDKTDEVNALLEKWVTDFDNKAAMREEKRRMRKAKEAARIRNKRGKVLTGRRLTERKKELQKMEKNAKRQGLSAPVSTAS